MSNAKSTSRCFASDRVAVAHCRKIKETDDVIQGEPADQDRHRPSGGSDQGVDWHRGKRQAHRQGPVEAADGVFPLEAAAGAGSGIVSGK
ncbi:hypothetical protein DESC_480183 [Desulfosarcina cetonica]|nr:hypothetical protein DESC_480183 [Desulfosarcina cetonica]